MHTGAYGCIGTQANAHECIYDIHGSLYIRHRAARHEWSVLRAFAVLLFWIGILLGDIRGSARTISRDLADPGRHQNSMVFTTLEPLRPANEALLGGPRSLPGVKGPKGTPRSSKWTPKGSHWEHQGYPNGVQRVSNGIPRRDKWTPKGATWTPKGA